MNRTELESAIKGVKEEAKANLAAVSAWAKRRRLGGASFSEPAPVAPFNVSRTVGNVEVMAILAEGNTNNKHYRVTFKVNGARATASEVLALEEAR